VAVYALCSRPLSHLRAGPWSLRRFLEQHRPEQVHLWPPHPQHATAIPAEARSCHVLFISQPDTETLKQALERVRGLPVLTVSESSDFLRLGGMINFVVEQDRVRFEINLEAAEQHHLKLSSKLLAVARVVNVGGGGI